MVPLVQRRRPRIATFATSLNNTEVFSTHGPEGAADRHCRARVRKLKAMSRLDMHRQVPPLAHRRRHQAANPCLGQKYSQTPADLVEDQAHQRLGAADVGWRHDVVKRNRLSRTVAKR
jgi:hypothetical protein